ncbi:MAG: insulinase family protein, partial [Endozoicomonas sp.]
ISELTIPEPNPFIADNLDLVESSKESNPAIILEKPGLRVWNLTDISFEMPRGNIRIMISSEHASKTPTENVLVQIYKSLLSRSLNEYGYPAKEAGLNYSITSGRRGVMISLSGYSDKQPLLLRNILEAVNDFQPEESAFEQEKAVLLRSLKNKQFNTPYRLGVDALSQLSYPSYPDDETLLKAAEQVSWKQLQQYAQDFYKNIHVEMLVLGNHTENSTLEMGKMVEHYVLNDANRNDRFDLSYHLLGDTDRVLTMNIEHDDSMLVSYYQLPETGNRERAQYALLGRLLSNPFFNALRTEQQLGYVVFAGPRPFEKHPGIIFVVQSPKLDPSGLEERIDQFLISQKDVLGKLTNEELEQYRLGLIGDLLKKDDNLDGRNNRFWQGIASSETNFDNRELIAEEIHNMTPTDMQAALSRLLENRGKLVVRSFGKPHQLAREKATVRHECTTMNCLNDLPLHR